MAIYFFKSLQELPKVAYFNAPDTYLFAFASYTENGYFLPGINLSVQSRELQKSVGRFMCIFMAFSKFCTPKRKIDNKVIFFPNLVEYKKHYPDCHQAFL